MSTRRQRRVGALERALRPAAVVGPVTALALDTSGSDLAMIGGEWVSCFDVAPILARRNLPVKVYLGFDPGDV
jgi:hypothetical protein